MMTMDNSSITVPMQKACNRQRTVPQATQMPVLPCQGCGAIWAIAYGKGLYLVADKGPELVQVDDWLEVLVLPDVEMPHSNLQGPNNIEGHIVDCVMFKSC